jgi:hypothetical protein
MHQISSVLGQPFHHVPGRKAKCSPIWLTGFPYLLKVDGLPAKSNLRVSQIVILESGPVAQSVTRCYSDKNFREPSMLALNIGSNRSIPDSRFASVSLISRPIWIAMPMRDSHCLPPGEASAAQYSLSSRCVKILVEPASRFMLFIIETAYPPPHTISSLPFLRS